MLTGGPLGGKTSCLPPLAQRLTERGIRVETVGECATEFIKNEKGKMRDVERHHAILKLILEKEKNAREAKPEVILFDRGIADGACMIPRDQFEKVLQRNNLRLQGILNRYDRIYHFESLARRFPLEYMRRQKDNPARKHGLFAALKMENRIRELYRNHARVQFLPATLSLTEKVDRIYHEIVAEIS